MSTEPSTRPETAPDRPTETRPPEGRPRRRAGAPTGRGRTDPWADETQTATVRNAPRTFDPRSTHRLRNLADGENAATPDADA